jgi:hypothetical protein
MEKDPFHTPSLPTLYLHILSIGPWHPKKLFSSKHPSFPALADKGYIVAGRNRLDKD